jgi:hypothetical protein
MKKTILGPFLIVFAYSAIYFLGQPFVSRSESLSQVWATAFYPLQRMQFRSLYSGVIAEKGTIEQDTDGGWGLTYASSRVIPGKPRPTQGIAFRVPPHLVSAVAAAKGKPVAVTIRKEPDPKHFSHALYVLDSVTLLPAE